MTDLAEFAAAVASGTIRVIDLTQTLTPEFPVIVIPPELGQCAPFRMETVSRYDGRGPGWYWNNLSMNEHTGTHFDAPIHWISGRDLAHNAVDTIPVQKFIAPAVVIDCTAAAEEDPDFLLTVDHITAWEAAHGRVPAGAWCLLRTGGRAKMRGLMPICLLTGRIRRGRHPKRCGFWWKSVMCWGLARRRSAPMPGRRICLTRLSRRIFICTERAAMGCNA